MTEKSEKKLNKAWRKLDKAIDLMREAWIEDDTMEQKDRLHEIIRGIERYANEGTGYQQMDYSLSRVIEKNIEAREDEEM